ncbi:DNA polymerase III subunit beta [bacterium]|nr:DNA polymerase III subunit beta [bacterium]
MLKISCLKKDLLKATQIIIGAITLKTTLPILSNILIEAKKDNISIFATDLEIGMKYTIKCNVIKEGIITIPARHLSNIVKELPEGELEIIEEKNNIIKIRSGRILFSINSLKKDEFPKFPSSPKEKSINVSTSVIKDVICKTSFAMSHDEVRYVLNGVYLEIAGDGKKKALLKAVATDGKRLAYILNDINVPNDYKKKVIVPSKTIKEILRIIDEWENVKIIIGEKQINFETDNILITSRLIEGHFPDYNQVLPKKYKERVKLNTEQFLTSVRRVALLVSDKTNYIKINIKNGVMILSIEAPEVGQAREEIEIDYKGEELIIAFDPNYITDVLKNIKDDEIYFDFIDSENPGVIRQVNSDNYLCVIMPIKI